VWNDTWWCSEEYDSLNEQQIGEMDPAARQDLVKQMQELYYYNAPYLVTANTSIAEAYRSDKWACLQPQPDPGGILLIQYGIHNYLSVRPADEAGDCDGVESALGAEGSPTAAGGGGGAGEDEGSSTGVLIGGGVLLAALVLGGGVFAMRRRGTAADRE
jgi:peptide/nickel transport system substrate-binding protein